jgi:PIN domain nuclease of toxin-antitoxin system
MNLLLDTHTFLWFIAGDSRLSKTARSAIEDLNNNLYPERGKRMGNCH